MRIYNYGGVISQNLLVVDLSDIKFIDFMKSFDTTKFNESERLTVSKISEYLLTQDIEIALTASDSRVMFCLNKLMVKYPDAKKFYGLNEWLIVYYFLKDFYDKSLPQIDSVIRFFNLYIGKMFAEQDALTPKEIKELVSHYNEVYTSLQSEDYKSIIPSFVYEELKENLILEGIYAQRYDELIMEESFDNLLNAIGV